MGMAQQQVQVQPRKKRVKRVRVYQTVQKKPNQRQTLKKHTQHTTQTRNKTSNTLKKFVFGLAMSFCIVLAGALLFRYTQITQMNNEITAVKKQISELEAKRDNLNRMIEPYKSTRRIEEIATVNLGMKYPSKDRVLHLNNAEYASNDINEKAVESAEGINISSRISNFVASFRQ